ncbi:hypothetical protein HNQ91_003586 [Filimonas zeae]|uniref:DNA/RNA non-specific endonuclease/pyrophosphatase/phosphodiesterase domain-containing protein n=1 Tax=Filimonas zeae TaxID=1737353 RepID=A0A917J034_9BACT|nr:DNA/RNA non-specific endonuclease [Filimonas zeae]MDR6340521.1 hypothetical protein [Filimonas zeae]GGH73125.1 hypothetical protein GCM10011379_34300 [Filimonas zeae]
MKTAQQQPIQQQQGIAGKTGYSINPVQLLKEKSAHTAVAVTGYNPLQLLATQLTYSSRQSASANDNSVLQRKVSDLTLTPDSNEDTILEVLKKKPFKGVYALPNEFKKVPRKGSAQFDRARMATATLSAQSSTKRGSATGDYKDVGALARWEKLASSHDLSEKTIDTGHLIADEFFDDDQKAEAYEAANLAPQNAQFNEEAYRRDVEVPASAWLAEGYTVKANIALDYADDKLKFPIDVLVERGALTVLNLPEHNRNLTKGVLVTVPRRMPTNWNPKVEIDASVPQIKPKASKKRKRSDKTTAVPVAAVVPHNVNREYFTSKVPFSGHTITHNSKLIDRTYKQGHNAEDPRGIRNPARIGSDPESGNYTSRQKERAKKTIARSRRMKILEQAQTVIAENPPSKIRKLDDNALLGKITLLILNQPADTPIKTIIKKVKAEFESAGFTKYDLGDFGDTMEEVFSEDEDPDNTTL